MGALMGIDKPDTSALEKQEEAAKKKEASLANELAARRRASAGSSKTIFSAVDGIGQATAKKTKLGG